MKNCPGWAKECCNHAFRLHFTGREAENGKELTDKINTVCRSLTKTDYEVMQKVFSQKEGLRDAVAIVSIETMMPERHVFNIIQKASLRLLIARGCVADET